MANLHRLAVVIPARNAARYLNETLASVVSQTRQANEIIVVDDQSTDETKRVITTFEHHGVRRVEGSGRGAAAALNVGIASTECELIAHFDADDIMLPNKLQREWEAFEVHEKTMPLGLVASDLVMFDVNKVSAKSFLESREHFRSWARQQQARELLLESFHGKTLLAREHCIDVKGVYKRRAWDAVGGFDEALRCAYDMDFVWRVVCMFNVLIIDEVLFRGRKHGSNLSDNGELVAYECAQVFRRMLRASLDPDSRRAIHRRLVHEQRELGYLSRKKGNWLRALTWYSKSIYHRATMGREVVSS